MRLMGKRYGLEEREIVHTPQQRFNQAVIFLTTFLLMGQAAKATSIARVKIEDLFSQADQVAVVKILSGDSEHYATVVYKAVVKNAYKGTVAGQTIYFGPLWDWA